jgi:hypothetical protein
MSIQYLSHVLCLKHAANAYHNIHFADYIYKCGSSH